MSFIKRVRFVFLCVICIMSWEVTLFAEENSQSRGGLKSNLGNDQDLFAEPRSDLKFPTNMEEILEALQPPLQASGARTRNIGGIADDLDEKFLEHASRVGAMIQFDYNSAKIKPESLPLLREYGKAFVVLKDARFVIAGHTDWVGSEKYNWELSRQRAEAIRKFLIAEFQLTEKRILIKPFGELKPIASNDTQEGRAKNRRVEFYRIN